MRTVRVIIPSASNLGAHPQQSTNVRVERVEGELMAVNSYLVHGPDGIVVVDGQLTVGDAAKVLAAVQAAGRPLAADHPPASESL